MQPEEDAFGQMLMACWRGERTFEVLERDDGLVNVGGGYQLYFAPYEDWWPEEKEALRNARGRVLDIGCGTGRHALYLQEQGQEVVGIDVSPLAAQVARERGVKDVRLLPITQLKRSLGLFDTILMMGGNFGLVGNPERARRLLLRFRGMTAEDARIIAASLNPYGTDDPVHLAYHEANRRRGRMAGQVRLRVRYRKYKGSWFDLLLVSPDEMQEIVANAGWRVSQLFGDPDGRYIAMIEKT